MATELTTAQMNPAWLTVPPERGFPLPPVDTRLQTLPYRELTWENFERLILRIVRREASVVECWAYGVGGQRQYGLDILADPGTGSGRFACYQCKRIESLSSDDIQGIVANFLQGKWAAKTERFVLCTSLALTKTKQVEELASQRRALAARGIDFEVWDGSEAGGLSERLKNHPDLVDDFFLREWVSLFNGKQAAQSLGERICGKDLAELRSQLQEIYSTLFHRSDYGIRIGSAPAIALSERYVAPDVVETRQISSTAIAPNESTATSMMPGGLPETREQTQQRFTTIQETRIGASQWLSRHERSLILGEPGYGKSALLRVIALQILRGKDGPLQLTWHGILPVWISFGGFSAAISRQDALSLEDYFDQWLHQHSADPVRSLFRRAVKQGDILLLIDGLDEGQNLHAARRAMDRLSTYLSIHRVPAILTSRQRGHTQVLPDLGWPVARLASFDEGQIEHFALNWFRHLETPQDNPQNTYVWAETDIEQRAAEFLKAIRGNPRVFDLAGTPLFCQLLIDVFRFSHHLPEQRIKVYDRAIDLLLSDHPAARAQAAELPSPSVIPRTDDIHEMLMRLALHIQTNSGAGVASTQDCIAVFCDFLTDDINGPGYTPYEASHQAKSLILYAQTGLGLLVERAPNELGFFHLTVQEYLAAQAMVRKEEQEQLAWLAKVWNESRWREVVLAWFATVGSALGRAATQRAVDWLEQVATGPLAELQLLRLRTELATGDLGLPPREARATIEEAAQQIETAPFPELQRELARLITLGLRSPSVAIQCERQVSSWLPSRPEFERARLLSVIGTWPVSKDLLDTLKIALRDDSARCRMAAAGSIARAFASDPAVADYLAKIAAKSPDTCVRAASLRALWKGWPRNDALAILSQVARDSADMDLAVTGIAVRVARRSHDADDAQRIWSMFCHGSVSYEMRDFCRAVLVDGWKSDEGLKKWAMNALRKHDAARFEEEQIITFLAQAWPSDQEVATCIADWFGGHPTSFLIHDHDKWRRLFEGFRGNADLSSALRRGLSDREERYSTQIWDPDTKWVYCIIGDDDAKADVLKAYDTVKDEISKVWVLSTLMEAWPEDSDVKKLLEQEYGRPPGEVAFLSPWISSLEPNRKKRRTWLLEALRQSSKRIVSRPVCRLLEEFQDRECIDAAMEVVEQDIWYYTKVEIKDLMIAKSPHLPQAREWANSAFEEIDGPSLSAVASGYQNDPDIRQRLLKAARPAKGIVRAEVLRVLREHSIPTDSVIRVTDEIWAEEKGEIRSAGVVARSNAAAQKPELKAPLVEKLRGEITSVGLHFEMRRRAAFAGLLQLGEYDICIEAAEEKALPRLHWLASYHDNDSVVTRALFEHWLQLSESPRMESKKFEIPWGPMITTGSVREALSDEALRTELIDALRTMKPQDRSPESLALTAELLAGSPDLRAHLIETLNGYSRHDSMLAAQRIFAQHFRGNPQALSELLEGTAQKPGSQSSLPPDMVYPVALGWPDSPLLRSYLDDQETPRGLPLVAVLTLSGISRNTRHALACIDRFVQVTKEDSWALPDVYSQSVRDWARSPSAEPLLRRLIEDPDTSRKITAIALLASAGKLTSEERVALLQELDELLGDTAKSCPDGVDLVSGRIMTLPQAIFRYLLPGLDTQLQPR